MILSLQYNKCSLELLALFYLLILSRQDAYASYNYAEYKSDPRPSDLNNDNHGTMNAGIVSMRRNSICGIGIAYNARIGGKNY